MPRDLLLFLKALTMTAIAEFLVNFMFTTAMMMKMLIVISKQKNWCYLIPLMNEKTTLKQELSHFRWANKLTKLIEMVKKHTAVLTIVSAKCAELISISTFVRSVDLLHLNKEQQHLKLLL